MLRATTILFLVIIPFLCFSQNPSACRFKTVFDCGTNMANEQFTDQQIRIIQGISYARTQKSGPDVNYYSSSNQNTNDCGVSGPSCSFDGSALTYDVYFPDSGAYACYLQKPLPAIFMFPGGGFSDCMDESEGTSEYCMALAKRGFIAFNVNYRRGRLKNPNAKDLTASQFLALYRACQDARGAIKTAILNNFFNRQFRFDTANIFIGGVSAGGQIALETAYVSSEEMNEEVFQDVSDVLGPINANYYKAPATATFSIKGVLNLWGALYTPSSVTTADFIHENSNIPPFIGFHGLKDNVLPPDEVPALLSQKYPYNTESTCLLQSVYEYPDGLRTVTHSGSLGLYNELTGNLSKPVHCEVYLDSDMGHGLDRKSDFGFGIGKISRDSLQVYIVQRAATFFQAIVNQKVRYLRTSQFTDCVNYRVQACTVFQLKDNNACTTTTINNFTNLSIADTSNNFGLVNNNKIVQLQLQDNSKKNILLFDMYGHLLQNISTFSSSAMLNCTSYTSGIYSIVVFNGNRYKRRTFFL